MLRPYSLFLIFLFLPILLWSQVPGQGVSLTGDSASLIGLKLSELISRYGPPLEVYASRGQESWQDDVVFVYSEGEFYIHRDRVWQLGLKSAYGISVGDSRPSVSLSLGEQAVDRGDYILLPLPSGNWPIMLRVNFSSAGRVSALFVYRPDF